MCGQGHPTPIHIQRPSQPPFQHTKSFYNTRFPAFQLNHLYRLTDRQTNWRTDKASYRVACPQLKRKQKNQTINCQPPHRKTCCKSFASVLRISHVWFSCIQENIARFILQRFSASWEKKIWNQIWIPQAIFYTVILTPSIYHAIWRHEQWFSDYNSLFFVLHQISRKKKHDAGHSDQISSRLWLNICIWDEFQAATMLFVAVCKFWHFFFAPKSPWFPARFLPIFSYRLASL